VRRARHPEEQVCTTLADLLLGKVTVDLSPVEHPHKEDYILFHGDADPIVAHPGAVMWPPPRNFLRFETSERL
jgi:hypothetical protein